ncbi:conserved Plasmodium protein, unknown function [Plasmodium knowlesi strain H]|uniref:Uncharacterized protein n=3 Tax=Plasmodium knowlesi TaxID=5850 RepID=A0A1A7VU08_PLAKH|nr:conserved Plasmodium protein, unknown function [Plasmodium knowlesi strain H]OTN68677.1 Uncharacterized protein PKNOH_S01012900 [Plasmodium knowlesi]CAA9986130.1 conserved Plasmodium protein, unknown function [Plasmodium knowlesi strain H]SBO25306.1 conserved Plasmodium protein, unknown function [Plasmodium knowlesi strain H]SBO27626.1 conserved Plasmodium protein, unknown function [Plasmodium knowlesi strain H]VVS75604.1 conserved Plasmodium protein, unknown function [Plasmodium knowlesi s
MHFSPLQLTLLVVLLIKFFSHALRNYKKVNVKSYIQVWLERKHPSYTIRREKKKSNYLLPERKRKWCSSFQLFSEDSKDGHGNGGDDEEGEDNLDHDNPNDGDLQEDEISYEDVEEYLKKNNFEAAREDDEGKKEIIKLINYLPTLKNEEEFFSKFGYSGSEKRSMEYYFNEMKNLKEKKQKKNHNILNFILSYYLKRKNGNSQSALRNYQSVQSYYDYINDVMHNRGASLSVPSAQPSKKDNIFSRKTLCNFISFYLKNANIIKYACFLFLSGLLTFSLKELIRCIKLEEMFLLRNHFHLVYKLKNLHVCKIGAFSMLLNFLFINKYNQYFCVTEDLFGILFSNYFAYEGINNLTKRKIEEFMLKYNYTLDDVLNSMNEMFSHYLYKQICTNETMDGDVLLVLNSFVRLYHKLFRNNKENIKNIISLVANKYNANSIEKGENRDSILSRIFYIFYLLNVMFKYDVDSVQRLNLHRGKSLHIPFFARHNRISNYFLLEHIAQQMGVKEKTINDSLLQTMKRNYEAHIRGLLSNKKNSSSVLEDVKKIDFLTLDNAILEDVHKEIFVSMVKGIMEDGNYQPVYFISLEKEGKVETNGLASEGGKAGEKYIGEEEDNLGDAPLGGEDIVVHEEGDRADQYDDSTDLDDDAREEDASIGDSDDNMYRNLESSVDYIVNEEAEKSGKNQDKKDIIAEKEKKDLEEKKLFLNKWNDINFLRKYLHMDKKYMDKYLEKYLYDYIYREYRILINNLIFKKMKNKNDNLFFLKKGISISNAATENIIKNILVNFVIKTKENIGIFLKLENMEKCLRLIHNLIYVYKKIKKKKKLLKVPSGDLFSLDDLFAFNCYKSLDRSGKAEGATKGGSEGGTPGQVSTGDGETGEGVAANGSSPDELSVMELPPDGKAKEGLPTEADEEELLKRIIYKDHLEGEDGGDGKDGILSEEDRKKLYEEFVIKHMKNQSERKILKIIFNLNYDQVDREVEDNIIKRFLDKICAKYLSKMKEVDDKYKIIGQENLFDYKNINFMESLDGEKYKKGHKKGGEGSVSEKENFIIRKEDIFDHIDDDSFEEICKKMYINKIKEAKKNLYQMRKNLYMYEIILNMKNAQEIHDIFLIDEYEKMIKDIIKTNILNKNYKNIKNVYLKKIVNFLNLSEEKAADVEMRCIYLQTYEIFCSVKENFYIYRSDSDFVNNINEILTIYKNFDLIKSQGKQYYVKFSLMESNYNLLHRIIERYVLYVIDLINDENRSLYKENIFRLAAIFRVNPTVIDEIATRIYKKYIESQDLHAMNNMDAFFSFLFNMEKERQCEIVLEHLRKKVDTDLASGESFQERMHKLYDIIFFINNNLQIRKNIFEVSSVGADAVYAFLSACIEEYLHVKKTEAFISDHRDYLNHLNNCLSKIKMLIKGDQENVHMSHVINVLKNAIVRKAISLLDKFQYDMCVEEIYNLIKLQMVDSSSNFADVDIEKRKKLVNIFSYQNISDEKKFLYMDILNKALL